MKKKLLLSIIIMFSFINITNAECDYKTKLEVNTAASNVDADIEMKTVVLDLNGKEHPEIKNKEETEDPSKYVYSNEVYLNITNVSDKIYMRITNEDDNLYQIIGYEDTDNGKYQYKVPDILIIRTYTIKIYSNVFECGNEEIRTLEVKAPMYNDLYGTRLCENNDALYCSKYITAPIENVGEILEKYDANKAKEEEEDKKNTPKEDSNEEDNKKNILILIGAIVIVSIIIIILIIKKRRKNKVNGGARYE